MSGYAPFLWILSRSLSELSVPNAQQEPQYWQRGAGGQVHA